MLVIEKSAENSRTSSLCRMINRLQCLEFNDSSPVVRRKLFFAETASGSFSLEPFAFRASFFEVTRWVYKLSKFDISDWFGFLEKQSSFSFKTSKKVKVYTLNLVLFLRSIHCPSTTPFTAPIESESATRALAKLIRLRIKDLKWIFLIWFSPSDQIDFCDFQVAIENAGMVPSSLLTSIVRFRLSTSDKHRRCESPTCPKFSIKNRS